MYVNNLTTLASYTGVQSTYKKDNTQNPSLTDESSGIKNFDFTQISRGDLLQTVNNLIKNGEMDLDESSSLVLLMGPKISVNGDFAPNSSNEIINVFDMLKQSISFNQSIGNTSGMVYDTKAFDALKRLQGSTSGINIVA